MQRVAEQLRRTRILRALHSRDFRLLFAGQAVSLVGDSAFVIALGWRVFTLSGSGRLGIVLMLEAAGMVATLLVGGALADRYPRQRLMIASDLARFVVVGALAGLDASGHLGFGALAGFALLMGLGGGFFQPAYGGIVPLVVEQPLLGSANALLGIARQASLIVGPALAAGLYGASGSSTVFALDAATFLCSAGLIARARPRTLAAEPTEHGALRSVGAGLRYVASVPWLWVTIVLFSLFLMLVLSPIQVLMPKLVHEHFHRGIGAYGLLQVAQGLGMIVGTVLFAQLDPRRRRGVVSYVIWTTNCAAIVAFALSPWYWLAFALAAVRGAGVGFGIAVWETMLMELVPERLLARVISVDFFGSIGLMPIGLVAAGAISGVASPGTLIAGGAALTGVLFLAVLPARWLRAVD
jgi:MFS family permease